MGNILWRPETLEGMQTPAPLPAATLVAKG